MEYIGGIQEKVKTSSSAVGLMVLKAVVALFIGLTLTMILDQALDYGWLSFILVLVTAFAILMRIMKTWSWGYVLIFSLICVLIGLLLRMYILIAPG